MFLQVKNSQIASYLCLLSAGTKGVHHYTWQHFIVLDIIYIH